MQLRLPANTRRCTDGNGGYANRVAWIDLTTGAIEYKPIAEEDATKYIGGRGLV